MDCSQIFARIDLWRTFCHILRFPSRSYLMAPWCLNQKSPHSKTSYISPILQHRMILGPPVHRIGRICNFCMSDRESLLEDPSFLQGHLLRFILIWVTFELQAQVKVFIFLTQIYNFLNRYFRVKNFILTLYLTFFVYCRTLTFGQEPYF